MDANFIVATLFQLMAMFSCVCCVCKHRSVELRKVCTKTRTYNNQSFINDNWYEGLIYLGHVTNTQQCVELLCLNSTSTMAFLNNNICFSVICEPVCPKVKTIDPVHGVERVLITVERAVANQHICAPQEKISKEYILINDVVRKIDTHVRPVLRNSHALKISVSLKLVQIIDVDELAQSVTFGAWTTLRWTNSLLTWNKEDYGNLSKINLSPDLLWRPTLFLYNDVSSSNSYRQNLRNQRSKIILENNGANTWFSTMVFIASCDINVRYFPFDEQFCSVRFGAWTEPSEKIQISPIFTENVLEVYLKNAEWELVNYKVVKELVRYECCDNMTISEVMYKFHLRRRTFYYVYTFIIPCGLLTWLVLLSFVLPPSSGERMILGLTVLVTMTVYLNIVSKQLPSTSDHIPLLSQYYFMLMVQITFSIILVIVNLCVFFKSGDPGPIPQWARYIFVDNLGFLVNGKITSSAYNKTLGQNSDRIDFMDRRRKISNESESNEANVTRPLHTTADTLVSDTSTDEDNLMSSFSDFIGETENHLIIRRTCKNSRSAQQRFKRDEETQRRCTDSEEESVSANLETILENEERKVYKKSNLTQWQFLSEVIDRILFFGFIITLVISTLSILGKPVYTDLK